MKKTIYISMILSLISANSAFSAPNDCSVTCYEKTPACYATEDKAGCITISNEKPKCVGKSCTCVLKGCERKTTYENGKKTTATSTEGKTSTSTTNEN